MSHLDHPNIVSLLSAYTFKGSHNLVFSSARGGDLAAFLRRDRPAEFRIDESLVLALAGLASAVENVHDFSADRLDLNLIGCHHDLKPKNILVHGASFILADFGLSRLKSISETSNTIFKKGQGDYMAPECEDVDGEFEKHSIRRSSDIWSFGCIVAEVLTYMILGTEGVVEFKRKRRYRLGNFIYYHFHHGPDQQSPGVGQWLSDLAISGTKMQLQLLSLIEAMLSVDPAKRPNATDVSSWLRLIGLAALAQSISVKYEEVVKRGSSVEALIEQARFMNWSRACGLARAWDYPELPSGAREIKFQSTVDTLLGMQETMNQMLDLDQQISDHLVLPLRHLNNRMRDLSPTKVQQDLQNLLEHDLIQTRDTDILNKTQNSFGNRVLGDRIAMLARIKLMTVLVDERSEFHAALKIEPGRLRFQSLERAADFDVADMEDEQGEKLLQVLIESMYYDSPLVDEKKGRERLLRVEAIAELLGSTDKPVNFRVLHCGGFFHDKGNHRYGLVFNFPASTEGECRAVTLGEILDDAKFRMPVLEDRYRLAHALAAAVLEFHKVQWVHKAISSFRIFFFPPKYASAVKYIAQPYIVGFNYSRPDDPLAFTEGASEGSNLKDYQHPEYLRDQSRYRSAFDYYSVGLVLLEIGLWTSLAKLTVDGRYSKKYKTSANTGADGFLEQLRRRSVPLLKETMGTRYFMAVERCLTGNFMDLNHAGDTASIATAVHLGFLRSVVEELACCQV